MLPPGVRHQVRFCVQTILSKTPRYVETISKARTLRLCCTKLADSGIIGSVRREHLISRYEHNFRGWRVTAKRQGKRFVRYFSDRPNGRNAAFRAARAYRDKLMARLPWPTKVKRKYVLNRTGVVGVCITVERTRAGRLMRRYVASWSRRDGSRGKASFSIRLYGKEEAFALAVQARRTALKRLGVKSDYLFD